MKMKIRFVLSVLTVFVLGSVLPLPAQAPPPTAADASGPITLSESDLEQLVAPIALYPDPLIALILPAAAVPSDIVLANRFLNNGGSADDIDAQPWDQNVKGLARYPDVLQMMDDNLDWTNQLGAAVLAQQANVMTAIQAQRAKAQALGNLQSSPQQQVVADQGAIQIVPADPQVIYVPYYDPAVVYVQAPPPTAPLVTFGIGLAIGAWLSGDCDWNNHGIYYGGYYRPGYGWGYNNVTINNNYYWRPNPHRPPPRPPYRPGGPGGPGRPGGNLPGWRPPPNWGKPGKPGGPGNRPGNRPGGPGNGPGNRPGGPGNGPGNRPGGPGSGPGNGPGTPGNRPGNGNGKPPTIQPVPGTKPTPTKPGNGPGNGGNRPGGGGNHKPPTTQPAPGPKPAPQPKPTRPAPSQPSTRPAPSRPGNMPSIQPHPSSPTRENTKRPTPQARPKPQARPQPAARNQPRGGPQGR
jgi:hypothetical protein